MSRVQMVERRERIKRLEPRFLAIGFGHTGDDRLGIFGDMAVGVNDPSWFLGGHGHDSPFRILTLR
jgi:hypothetical protein